MPTSSREDFVNGLMGQEVAQEVYAAALPGGIQVPGGGGLEAFMGIGDHQLDAAQAAPGQGAQELGPVRTAVTN